MGQSSAEATGVGLKSSGAEDTCGRLSQSRLVASRAGAKQPELFRHVDIRRDLRGLLCGSSVPSLIQSHTRGSSAVQPPLHQFGREGRRIRVHARVGRVFEEEEPADTMKDFAEPEEVHQ